MKVRINPDRKVDGKPLRVINPIKKVFYPAGEFDLSDKELRDPRVIRLLPPVKSGGVPGGRFGDLVPVKVASKAEKKG
ncbi:hypothetical protein [Thalassospira lucentensis]|uniref:hypothetical protein n=1 Tax=Thalassospira lucentensis TaxID=168935 RepID=UPI003D2D879A